MLTKGLWKARVRVEPTLGRELWGMWKAVFPAALAEGQRPTLSPETELNRSLSVDFAFLRPVSQVGRGHLV